MCGLPLPWPGVWHTAHNRREHEGSDEGEQNQVDKTFDPIVTQPRQSLDVVLYGRREETSQLGIRARISILQQRNHDSPYVGCGSQPGRSAGGGRPR